MATAIFTNYSDHPFVGYWDGKARKFMPKESKSMKAYLAAHFAKHLANRELLRKGPQFEGFTSPKFPDQVPQFMEEFNKAFKLEKEDDELEMEDEVSDMDDISSPKPKKQKKKTLETDLHPSAEGEDILIPAPDDDEFEGSPNNASDEGGNSTTD